MNKQKIDSKKLAEKINFETFQLIKRDVEEKDALKFNKYYRFKIYQYQYRTWVPQAREGAILLNLPGTNDFILYGGVAQEPLKGVAKLSIFGNTDCKWDINLTEYACDSEKLKGRYGFHGVYFNNKIFYFFGCEIYNKQLQERTCLNEIVIYDPYQNEINVQYPYHFPEKFLEPRKYFSGFLLHDTYYCHGGVDTKGKPLNSFI